MIFFNSLLSFIFLTKYSAQSQTERRETPTKRLREPPRSARKEMVGKAQTSLSSLTRGDSN